VRLCRNGANQTRKEVSFIFAGRMLTRALGVLLGRARGPNRRTARPVRHQMHAYVVEDSIVRRSRGKSLIVGATR